MADTVFNQQTTLNTQITKYKREKKIFFFFAVFVCCFYDIFFRCFIFFLVFFFELCSLSMSIDTVFSVRVYTCRGTINPGIMFDNAW